MPDIACDHLDGHRHVFLYDGGFIPQIIIARHRTWHCHHDFGSWHVFCLLGDDDTRRGCAFS